MSPWARVPRIAEKDFVLLDTETAIVEGTMRIVEIGMLLVRKGKIVDTLESLVHPGGPVTGTWPHGIDDDDLQGKPRFTDLKGEIGKFIAKGEFLVAHNASFDIRRIRKELGKK